MDRVLTDILIEWQRRRESPTPASVDALCADHPDLLPEARRLTRRLAACDRLLADAGLDAVPKAIGRYEVRGVLGRGGMGVVYDGWDTRLPRRVAVKVLRGGPFGGASDLANRLLREGAVLAQLDHPHIVPVYDSDVWDEQPFLVMARVDGGTLASRRAELTARGPREVATFMEKVARAVHAAHSLGILHRDLKPANILVDGRGEPRVTDFGLASAGETPARPSAEAETVEEFVPTDATRSGLLLGTPAYMAPEQYDPAFGPIGPAADVWALGVVLFEVLTGRKPFPDRGGGLEEQICRGPTPACRGGRVPPWLAAVVARCLTKDPAGRFKTAAEMADALRAGVRRRRLAKTLTAVALVLAAAIGLGGGNFLFTPKKEVPFEQLPEVIGAMDRLSRGEEVVLADETHRAPFRWVFGDHTGQERRTESGHLGLASLWLGPAPVEFLPRLPDRRFRIEARVRHDGDNGWSRVGLYIDGTWFSCDDVDEFRCAWVEFADWGELATHPLLPGEEGNSTAQLNLGRLRDPRQSTKTFEAADYGAVRFNSAAFENREAEFRTIGIDVDATGVRGRWGQRPFGRISRQRLAEFDLAFGPGQGNRETGHIPRTPGCGSVGLIVQGGWVSVEYLRVIPQE